MNPRLFLLFFIILSSLNALAQQKNISIDVRSKPLVKVLNELEQAYNITFAYSSNQVNLRRKVSLKVNDVTLNDALTQLFAGMPVAFTVNGNNVVLYYTSNYKVTLSGYLREKGTGELLIGAVVNSKPLLAGAATNAYGFYSITLPADTYTFYFNYTGYKQVEKRIILTESKVENAELEAATNLNEVLVTAENKQQEHIKANSVEIPLAEIKAVPAILGEKDVVKYLLFSSGVQKGNEGNAYMYVRGGAADQNLVMIDDAVIYNAYHFLGLSSLFSGNELRKAELVKGGFSSKYGGRLSSVLDMSMKDGNREKYSGEATAGLIASRIQLEGPIIKNKSSFLVSLRRCYLDQVTKAVSGGDALLNYNYYDLHAKVSTDLGKRNRLMLSGYIGNDLLRSGSDERLTPEQDGISWGNKAASLRWNHEFNGKLFLTTSLVYSYYKTRTAFGEIDPSTGIAASSAIQSTLQDFTLKADLDYMVSPASQFRMGAGATSHSFQHNTETAYEFLFGSSGKSQTNSSDEYYLYGEWNYKFYSKWHINPGMRLSNYNSNANYFRPEPRFKAAYNINKNTSAHVSYSLMNQYLHMLSMFTGLGFPNDAWVSSDKNLKPQRAHLYTAGISRSNISGSNITLIIEGYYKQVENAVSVREGYTFFNVLPIFPGSAVENWSDITTQGMGESKGLEFSVKKEGRRLNIWASYTLSRTTFVFDDVNNGKSFIASYDRTHDIGLFASYKTGKRFLFSASWVYGTGNAITVPTGEFYSYVHEPGRGLNGYQWTYSYDNKNNFRMRSFHKLDLSVQYFHKLTRFMEGTLELSLYNAYNRRNPFFYETQQDENGRRTLKQLSLFPVIPALNWTIRF